MVRTLPCVLTMVALISCPALAQDRRPPVELGVGVSTLGAVDYDEFGTSSQPPALDLRLTVPLSSRFAVEGGSSVSASSGRYAPDLTGFYSIQVKQRIVRGTKRDSYPFVTYGAAGWFEHNRVEPYDYRKPDGTTVQVPGYSYTYVEPPWNIAIGAGYQEEFASHAAVRVDAQLITFFWLPIGVRFTAGLSIPFGHYAQAPSARRH